jgi:hypothetical protein
MKESPQKEGKAAASLGGVKVQASTQNKLLHVARVVEKKHADTNGMMTGLAVNTAVWGSG